MRLISSPVPIRPKAQFIKEMNIKAALLGMKDSVFYDSIGLNNDNRSSAVDLSYLITGASEYALIRELDYAGSFLPYRQA